MIWGFFVFLSLLIELIGAHNEMILEIQWNGLDPWIFMGKCFFLCQTNGKNWWFWNFLPVPLYVSFPKGILFGIQIIGPYVNHMTHSIHGTIVYLPIREWLIFMLN